MMWFKYLIVFSVFLLTPAASWATIHTVGPSDCGTASVQAAINAAIDGDVVELICTGTATWTSTVTIPDTKGITLQVKDGTNGTWNGGRTARVNSSFPLIVTGTADPMILINCDNLNSVTRITGFKFQTNLSSGPSQGAILVTGRGTGTTGQGAYRIDNNYFDDIKMENPKADLEGAITVWAGYQNNGILTGLIDNNTLHDAGHTDSYGIAILERWQYGGSGYGWEGWNSWTRDFTWGSNDFQFIEDNLIENVSQYTRHSIMGDAGGRYVIRYNTFDMGVSWGGNNTDVIDAHGMCICNPGTGFRGGEIYSNLFRGAEIGQNIGLRGGEFLVYDNTFEDAANWRFMSLTEIRAFSSCSQCSSCAPETSSPTCVSNGTDYPLLHQIQNSYFWNNLYNSTNQIPVVDSRGVQTSYIQSGRDYYVSTSKPTALSSYSSYIYPHPLRSVLSSVPPTPPKNLRIIQ